MNETTPNQESAEKLPPASNRLYRSVVDRKIAGVCGGVAEHFGIDPILVRVLWVVSCFVGLFGLFAYAIAWMIIPENPYGATAAPRPAGSGGRYVWGAVLVVLGIILLAEQHDFHFLVPWHYIPHWMSWGVVFSVLLILFGLFLVVRSNEPAGASSAEPVATKPEEAVTPSSGEPSMKSKRLTRSFRDRMIGGVCGGLAEYFNVDPSLIRVGWVLMTFFSGFFFGIIAYVVLMVVVPEQRPETDGPPPTGTK